jgi:hypothetical protein
MPVVAEWGFKIPQGSLMEEGRAYQSDTNEQWITQQEIKEFISKK